MSVFLTRRSMMLGTLAAIGAGALTCSGVVAAAAQGAGRRGAVTCVLDSSMEQYITLRAAAEGAGMAVVDFERDVGMLAMRIDALWRVARSPLCGITLASSYFILEQIARRHDMVPVFAGEHCCDYDGSWRHDLRAQSPTLLESVSELPGGSWPSQVCNVLHEASRRASAKPVEPAARYTNRCDAGGRSALRLLSWSIAANG